MKNLLLIAALGVVIAGCDSAAGTNEVAATNLGATNSTANSGQTDANVSATNLATETTNGTAVENVSTTSESASSTPTDAMRDMESAGSATASASADGTAARKPKTGEEVAVMETAQGRIVLMFFPDKAPKHVESFKSLAKKGFFDNTAFHRVIPGFMIQGGDPYTDPKRAKGQAGTGGPGYTVKAEQNDVKHVRGILSAARSQDRDSAGSQFFIMHAEAPFLDNEYDAYGKVVSGLEVVDKIVNLPNSGPPDNSNLEIDKARVKSVRIVKWPVK